MEQPGVSVGQRQWIGWRAALHLPLDGIPAKQCVAVHRAAKDLQQRSAAGAARVLAQEFPAVRGRVSCCPMGRRCLYPVQFRRPGPEPSVLLPMPMKSRP